ncbi:hypothetical protein HGM15179_018351, partial [Zosterops borbonicus]
RGPQEIPENGPGNSTGPVLHEQRKVDETGGSAPSDEPGEAAQHELGRTAPQTEVAGAALLHGSGVTGTSWKRQEFLIIGKDRSSILGLIIYPTVIAANQNEELTVLAQALRAPLIIPENTPIAKAIALPPNAVDQHIMPIASQQTAVEDGDMETHVF